MNLLRSSSVQVPPLAFAMAAEKLNPRPSPLWSPTMPYRFGPTRLGPPFSKVWQAAHFFAAAALLDRRGLQQLLDRLGRRRRGFLAAAGAVFLHRDFVARLFLAA